jgi:hypothetical protein
MPSTHLLCAMLLHQQGSQLVQGVSMARLLLQDHPVALLSGGQLLRAVQLHTLRAC